MINKTAFYQKFKKVYSERGFDINETIKWLSYNKSILWSWGYNTPTALKKDEITTGLLFNVYGHHHKGWVLITLGWNDTYTLRFFSNEFQENKEKVTNVYCDELQERVDSIIEKIPDYNY